MARVSARGFDRITGETPVPRPNHRLQAGSYLQFESVHSNPPVISRSFAKNAFLRGELMPQSTGTLW